MSAVEEEKMKDLKTETKYCNKEPQELSCQGEKQQQAVKT